MSVEEEGTRYDMGRTSNRGFALIFVNDEFEEKTRQETRRGADIDYDHLTQCFSKLRFHLLVVRNQTTTQTLKLLKKFAEGPERQEEHAVVVAFSTHGDQFVGGEEIKDGIYCTDGRLSIPLVTSILAKSEGLKNKPKLLFIQACRGWNYDTTFKKSGDDVMKQLTMDTSGLDCNSSTCVKVPLHKDMFMACSAPPGYKSFRHKTRGSFFITALHDVIMNNGNDLDLLDLMTLVINKSRDSEFLVKKGELWETDCISIPWIASMLLKEVWFK